MEAHSHHKKKIESQNDEIETCRRLLVAGCRHRREAVFDDLLNREVQICEYLVNFTSAGAPLQDGRVLPGEDAVVRF